MTLFLAKGPFTSPGEAFKRGLSLLCRNSENERIVEDNAPVHRASIVQEWFLGPNLDAME